MQLFDLSSLQTVNNFGNFDLALIWMTVVSIFMFAGPATLGTALIFLIKERQESKLSVQQLPSIREAETQKEALKNVA